jgi:hypothetical protein
MLSIKEEILCFVVGHAFMHIEGERRQLHYDNRHGRHEINTRK